MGTFITNKYGRLDMNYAEAPRKFVIVGEERDRTDYVIMWINEAKVP
jgi:hypothetical protein